jgi:hypothetical protein
MKREYNQYIKKYSHEDHVTFNLGLKTIKVAAKLAFW